MKTIKYEEFWGLIDKFDIYLNSHLSRSKYKNLMHDDDHYPAIKDLFFKNPVLGFKLIVVIYLLKQNEDLKIYMYPQDCVMIKSNSSFYSLRNMVKKTKYNRKTLENFKNNSCNNEIQCTIV